MKTTHDVIVVGGGVIGNAVAWQLAQRGARTLLIDKSLPGRASAASAGGLWPVGEGIGLGCGVILHAQRSAGEPDAGASGPEMLPPAFRDFLVRSNRMFADLAVELRERTGIDIELDVGAGLLYLIYDEREAEFVRRIVAALGDGPRVEMLTPGEVRRLEPRLTGSLEGAALLKGEHQVNPMLLAEAFKRAAVECGATFRHDTAVTRFVRERDRVIGVAVGEEILLAETVVNAAGAWAGGLAATAGIALPVVPVRGQVVLTEALPRLLASCLSTSDCYLCQKRHGEVLIGSTTEQAGFDVSVTPEAIRRLCRGAVRAVPMLRQVGVKRIWAGLRPGTPDELPILGPAEGLAGYQNAAGGFRTGIVAAPLTGKVVAQCVLGETAEVGIEPFLASRFREVSPVLA